MVVTPLRIYNTPSTHWRQYTPGRRRPPIVIKAAEDPRTREIEELKTELRKHKNAESKIKRHAKWMLRSTGAAHNDAKAVIEIIKDLYGDDAFE